MLGFFASFKTSSLNPVLEIECIPMFILIQVSSVSTTVCFKFEIKPIKPLPRLAAPCMHDATLIQQNDNNQ